MHDRTKLCEELILSFSHCFPLLKTINNSLGAAIIYCNLLWVRFQQRYHKVLYRVAERTSCDIPLARSATQRQADNVRSIMWQKANCWEAAQVAKYRAASTPSNVHHPHMTLLCIAFLKPATGPQCTSGLKNLSNCPFQENGTIHQSENLFVLLCQAEIDPPGRG